MFGIAQKVQRLGLRERVSLSILREAGSSFDMKDFKPKHDHQLERMDGLEHLDCGTACCGAGHIVAVAKGPAYLALLDHGDIADEAYNIWRETYGFRDADRLGFTVFEWGNLNKVTADEFVAHLHGAPAIRRH